MAQDEALTRKRLDVLWTDHRIQMLPIQGNSYILLSDVHLGNKGSADDFRHNEDILEYALHWYSRTGFKLVLLGDIEELWQFDLPEIEKKYRDSIYKAIRGFDDENVFRVFGNHDDIWCPPEDPIRNLPNRFGPGCEALKLGYKGQDACMMVVHGHQGNLESDKFSSLSRKPVRFFRYFEGAWIWVLKILGLYCPARPETDIKKDYERIMYRWARDNHLLLICGHSHRAMIESLSYAERLQKKLNELSEEKTSVSSNSEAERKQFESKIDELRSDFKREKRRKMIIIPVETEGDPLPCYFNTGCSLYENGITGIEIKSGQIRLVKWSCSLKGEIERTEYEVSDLDSLINKCCSLPSTIENK